MKITSVEVFKGETYKKAGVNTEKEEFALKELTSVLYETFLYRDNVGKCLTPFGHYAGVIQINDEIAIALKTDGVGTKLFIAQLMDKYDTVGIDCIAMVVNDIICTGAEPLSIVDYLAVQDPDPKMLKQIGIGLKKGAEMARVNVVGGEIAQVREMIKGVRPKRGFDLVGMGIGILHPKEIIKGDYISEGDIVIGIKSSGIHSNGLTMARKILLKKMGFNIHDYFDELGRTLGEELLEPTSIYVREIMDMKNAGLHLKNVAHITSDGLLNLARVGNGYGYIIDYLPEVPPIFNMIKRYGKVHDKEMYRVYNMGVGLCVVLSKTEGDDALQIIEKYGKEAFVMGYTVKDPEKKIVLKPLKIIGDPKKGRFY